MMPLETIVAGIMLVSLIFYALLAGADYGGGVWDLFAFGTRAKQQRELIAKAISPVWEANHVWLILVIVILFTAFPPAFATAATALHIPLTLMLIGIVLRGTAFTFRTYDSKHDRVQRRWSLLFSIASIITPIVLGITLGAIASGTIRVENNAVTSGFFASWLALFPFAVGFFALALFAFLAAVYLTLETNDRQLQEDFRNRALVAGAVVGILALIVFLLAATGAPTVRAGISRSRWALALHILTAIFASGAFLALWTRRFRWAQICAAAQVSLILAGWAFAQYPFLIEPDITITTAAAPRITLQLLLGALGVGAVLLFPSYYYLFRVFKRKNTLIAIRENPDKVIG
ncbi:MAG TPA: cytochrome d ubiquinol oxidase subunit II [Pyrinomonadaceae bacterium]|jgi:cytochrome d ubiquinol oxidase subunit II|nr:cytochrome d ubiquinol oxidase subunit II [Pyrinomonadaceae bacterium]